MCRRRACNVAFIEVPEWMYDIVRMGPCEMNEPMSSCAASERRGRYCGWRPCQSSFWNQPETFEMQPGRRFYGNTPVDVHEHLDGYNITVDVPGLDRDRIIVLVDEDIIIVAGDYDGLDSADDNAEDTDGRVLRRERRSGRSTFERRFRLPIDVLGDAVSYDVRNGVLNIFLPKKFGLDYDHDHQSTESAEAGPSTRNMGEEDQNEKWVDVMDQDNTDESDDGLPQNKRNMSD